MIPGGQDRQDQQGGQNLQGRQDPRQDQREGRREDRREELLAREAHQSPWMSDDTPMVSAIGSDPPEESVVLANPEEAALLETARVDTVAAHVGDRSWILRRQPVRIWVVAAALIGGASLALSAQAVMRRPVRSATVSSPARTTALQAAMNPIVVRSPVVAPSTLAPGVVVLLPDPQESTIQVSPPTTTVKAPHRGRPQRSIVRARSRGRTEAAAAKWVDPFITKRPAIVAPTPVTPPRVTEGSATPSTRTKWVDPFAD